MKPAGPPMTLGTCALAQLAIHISATNNTDAPSIKTIRS